MSDITNITNELKKILTDYQLQTSGAMIAYYLGENVDGKSASLTYFDIVAMNDYGSSVVALEKQCKSLILACGQDSVANTVTQLSTKKLSNPVKQVKYEYCCSEKMIQLANSSELYCKKCNNTFDIKGVVFDDMQFYSQDGKKSKHGKYFCNKNLKNWLDHILCRAKPKIPDAGRELIAEKIRRDKRGEPGKAVGLTIQHIIAYLKEGGLAKYNMDSAYLLSIFTGKFPPYINDTEYCQLLAHYKLILDTLTEISKNKHNTEYCPYYIAKLIEMLWPDDTEKMRILHYIHHKKQATIYQLDHGQWKMICEKNKEHGFVWKATDYAKLVS